MKELDYGVVVEFENGTELWFEPFTDEMDGFVLRKGDKDGTAVAFFSEDEIEGKRRFSEMNTKKYDEIQNQKEES